MALTTTTTASSGGAAQLGGGLATLCAGLRGCPRGVQRDSGLAGSFGGGGGGSDPRLGRPNLVRSRANHLCRRATIVVAVTCKACWNDGCGEWLGGRRKRGTSALHVCRRSCDGTRPPLRRTTRASLTRPTTTTWRFSSSSRRTRRPNVCGQPEFGGGRRTSRTT